MLELSPKIMMDPFEVLGVEAAFMLDVDALEQRHRELSGALHPDRYVGRPPSERREALSKAIEVNQAFRELRDPVRRAEAIVRRLGVPVSEDTAPKPRPELLMEMMEQREQLSEARQNRDARAVDQLCSALKAREETVLAELGRILDAALKQNASERGRFEEAIEPGGSEAGADASRAAHAGAQDTLRTSSENKDGALVVSEEVLSLLGELRYYRRFFEEADAIMDELI